MLRGKYRIDRVLGVGGMASVYAATHRNGRRVAVKVLHPAVSLQADMRRRFLREGHAANAVNHPGAVVVIDDDVAEDGAAFLVMELLDGVAIETLWERNGGRLPPDMVLAIGYELCGVLEAAHRAGIVHRDIKPANLFLTHEGQLKVLDFGLAQLRDGQTKLTANGMVFGTPAFMAPEQAAGRLSQVDPRSDIWAVGATMFTLLSGRTVHEGHTVQEVLVLAATEAAPSLASVLPNADPRLLHLIDRALTLAKHERWPSAGAMRLAISTTSLELFGEGIPRLKTPNQLPNLYKSRASNFALVDLSKQSGDLTDEDVPSETDIVAPPTHDGAVVDLSRSESSESSHDDGPAEPGEATDADMPSVRDLPARDSEPPDLSDDGPGTKSDAPTALYQTRPSQPALPPPRPPPKRGWNALHDAIDRQSSPNGERSSNYEPLEDADTEGETLVHRALATPQRALPIRTPSSGKIPPPASSRDVLAQPRPVVLQASTSIAPPTTTDKVDMRLGIARGATACLRRGRLGLGDGQGLARAFRAHPQASIVVLLCGALAMVIVASVAIALVARRRDPAPVRIGEIEGPPRIESAAPVPSAMQVGPSDSAKAVRPQPSVGRTQRNR